MKNPIQPAIAVPLVRDSYRLSPSGRGFLIVCALACLMPLPTARAVDPPPDGGYPNNNTAEGDDALFNLTTAFNNTAIGFNALFFNTTGGDNTATGAFALFRNATGDNNTATGDAALFSNTTGKGNTASGVNALGANTRGKFNTAHGLNALFNNTTGSFNIAVGDNAGFNLKNGSNNIYIGNTGTSFGESATIRIGTTDVQTATFIAGINEVTVPNGVGVIVGTDGKLGTVVSSKRFKDTIKPMDKASEAILALKPVTFRYKQELDPDGIPQFGLVAEEVEKVNPDLVARDEQGKPYTVRYEAVNAMLLNEFLKEHRKNEQQEAKIVEQQKQIQALTAALKEQDAQIQRVSAALAAARPSFAGLEARKSSPQIVLNNQ